MPMLRGQALDSKKPLNDEQFAKDGSFSALINADFCNRFYSAGGMPPATL